MTRETKFGLLLVCVLTSVFGVLVYKRLHKPADLVAGTDHDPAALAIADQSLADVRNQPTPQAAEPTVSPAATPDLLALDATPNQPPSKIAPSTPVRARPVAEVDPFSADPIAIKPAQPQPRTVDFTDNAAFDHAAPVSKTTRVVAEPVPVQSEPAPFAAEPVIAKPQPMATVANDPLADEFVNAATPQAAAAPDGFDPFAAPVPTEPQPPTTIAAAPVSTEPDPFAPAPRTKTVALPVEVESDPFAQEPPAAAPVTTSSRSATIVTEPVREMRSIDPEPVPVAKPLPALAVPVVQDFDDPFATPKATPKPSVTSSSPPAAIPLQIPETKSAATESDTLTLDPLDIPVAKPVTSAARPAPRQPQPLPIDLGFDPPAATPVPVSAVHPVESRPTLTAGGYVVEPGDNFWIISKKLYGTGRYFQALAAHNAGTVTDPAKMKPGLRIAAPSTAELETRYAAVLSATNAGSASSAMPMPVRTAGFFVSEAGQPMYRVGSEDTLSGIAFAHLGRASRWVQIFEMNRQVLKDGNTLKVGSELKLPADASHVQMTGAAGGRR